MKDIVNIPSGEIMDQDLLKKYIIYSRKYVSPKMTKINVDKISNFYAELRRESKNVGGITIVTRHIESLIRMAQASARIHLRNEVKPNDIDLAISVLRKWTKLIISSREFHPKSKSGNRKGNQEQIQLLHFLQGRHKHITRANPGQTIQSK